MWNIPELMSVSTPVFLQIFDTALVLKLQTITLHLCISFTDVCVKFAKNQPAPRGNLAVHCGGPGSLSSCLYSMGVDEIGQDNAGRSIPLNLNPIDVRVANHSTHLPSPNLLHLKTTITSLHSIR